MYTTLRSHRLRHQLKKKKAFPPREEAPQQNKRKQPLFFRIHRAPRHEMPIKLIKTNLSFTLSHIRALHRAFFFSIHRRLRQNCSRNYFRRNVQSSSSTSAPTTTAATAAAVACDRSKKIDCPIIT